MFSVITSWNIPWVFIVWRSHRHKLYWHILFTSIRGLGKDSNISIDTCRQYDHSKYWWFTFIKHFIPELNSRSQQVTIMSLIDKETGGWDVLFLSVLMPEQCLVFSCDSKCYSNIINQFNSLNSQLSSFIIHSSNYFYRSFTDLFHQDGNFPEVPGKEKRWCYWGTLHHWIVLRSVSF